MKVLVIGGTRFVGRHMVEVALKRGHEVTVFNRGRSGAGLFDGVEEIHGDREQDIGVLSGRNWDAVVDTCGYTPEVVRRSAGLLREAVEHYTFISTISVYRQPLEPGADESAPLETLPKGAGEETPGAYGALKALCEKVVDKEMDGRALNVRPGLIVGPHDPTGRFTYWVARMARGGLVLAPGAPTRPVQFIDARDLAEWVLAAAERRLTGTYNATGPEYTLTMENMLQQCRLTNTGETHLVWASDEFLLQQGIEPFSGMPLWLPAEQAGFLQVDVAKAIACGLSFRPLARTAEDVLRWAEDHPVTAMTGPTPVEEGRLIEELRGGGSEAKL